MNLVMFLFFQFLFFFWWYWCLNSALHSPSILFYQLSHAVRPVCFRYFKNTVFYLFLKIALEYHPPIYVSCLAGMTSVGHHNKLLLVDMLSCKHFVHFGH
jgi:hypothetical protein